MPPKKAKPETPDDTVDLPDKADDVVEIEFRGQVFTVPKDRDDWPTKAIVALQRNQYAAVVEDLLGSGQWEMLNAVAPKYREFMEFLAVFGETVSRECVNG